MMNLKFIILAGCLCCIFRSYAQSDDPGGGRGLTDLSSRFLHRIQRKTADMDEALTKQTEKFLQKMAKREERMRRKLYRIDSTAAKQLFDGSMQKYALLSAGIRADSNRQVHALSGEYQPYTDSLNMMVKFLPGGGKALSQLQLLQSKMGDADKVKAFVSQRRQQINEYISQHVNVASLFGKSYLPNEDIYYYSQRLRNYSEMLNDPDKLETQALALLNKLPAFQSFMKQNSQLASLFNLPGNYGTAQGLAGLQSKDQVGALINSQLATGGEAGQAALQGNLSSAQSQLDGYKDKLSQLGGGSGSGDIDMPNFKPNQQKTKTFWNRLEFGTNIQTTRNSYFFPTVSDFGLSVGYKLKKMSTAGLGISYKLGWGNGIQHIALSSEGVGLRSFADIKMKGSIYASGGFEYNYTTPFQSMQQLHKWDNWTRSGLIGASKIISIKSKAFKTTKIQVLWDFLSYSQLPKTQPIVFRIGYVF